MREYELEKYKEIYDGVGYGKKITVKELENRFKKEYLGLTFEAVTSYGKEMVMIANKHDKFGIMFCRPKGKENFFLYDNVMLVKDVV